MKGITFSSVKMNCESSVMMGCYKTTGGKETSTREGSLFEISDLKLNVSSGARKMQSVKVAKI